LKKNKWTTCSLEETNLIGQEIAAQISGGTLLCFHGTLGAGKTTLAKSIISHLASLHPHQIPSPTFSYVLEYGQSPRIYHFDLYRLSHQEEFTSMGFDEYFHSQSICLIEWPDRISPLLPSHALHIDIEIINETSRSIQLR